jgi:hypothetical protein
MTTWVSLDCPKCGHEEETAAEWLAQNMRLLCPKCIGPEGLTVAMRPRGMIPHIVIEVRGGVVQVVDGFSTAEEARAAYPLLTEEFTEEPKTGAHYIVLDHDNLEAEPPPVYQPHPMSGHYGPEGVGR